MQPQPILNEVFGRELEEYHKTISRVLSKDQVDHIMLLVKKMIVLDMIRSIWDILVLRKMKCYIHFEKC